MTAEAKTCVILAFRVQILELYYDKNKDSLSWRGNIELLLKDEFYEKYRVPGDLQISAACLTKLYKM